MGTECGNVHDLFGHIDVYDVAHTPCLSPRTQCSVIIPQRDHRNQDVLLSGWQRHIYKTLQDSNESLISFDRFEIFQE